jgi:hypothetical protein
MLSKFTEENQKDWDCYVPLMTMAYRATPQETTKISPNKLMFGREIDLPVDIMFGKPEEIRYHLPEEYVSNKIEQMEMAFEYVRNNLAKNAVRQKRIYDLKSSGNNLEKGQKVWLFTPFQRKGLSSKLARKWTGPYIIIEKLGDVLFKIKKNINNKKEKTKLVHFDRLKLYFDDTSEESSEETEREGESEKDVPVGFQSSDEELSCDERYLENPVSSDSFHGECQGSTGAYIVGNPVSSDSFHGECQGSAGGNPFVLDSVGRDCQENLGKFEKSCTLDWTEAPQSSGRTGALLKNSARDMDSVGRTRQDVPGVNLSHRSSSRIVKPPRRLIEEM